MKKPFLIRHIKHILIPGLFGLVAIPGVASAAEESNLFESLFNWSDAVAEEGQVNVTASHVFRATRDLIAEIEVLRNELGVYDYPVEAEMQEDRASVHLYAKTLEVLSKVSRVQRRFGVTPAELGQIPIKEIVPADVLRSVNGIIDDVPPNQDADGDRNRDRACGACRGQNRFDSLQGLGGRFFPARRTARTAVDANRCLRQYRGDP